MGGALEDGPYRASGLGSARARPTNSAAHFPRSHVRRNGRERALAPRSRSAHDPRRARSDQRGAAVRQRVRPRLPGRRAQTRRLLRQRRRPVFDGGHGDRGDPAEHPVGVGAQRRAAHGGGRRGRRRRRAIAFTRAALRAADRGGIRQAAAREQSRRPRRLEDDDSADRAGDCGDVHLATDEAALVRRSAQHQPRRAGSRDGENPHRALREGVRGGWHAHHGESGLRVKTLSRLVCLADFEAAARRKLPAATFDFVAGGAADELTMRWNREAYERIRLRPHVLVDVSAPDTRVALLGLDLPHPILLAPTAYQKLFHRGGEVATARGAGASGAVFVVSSNATTAIEDVARAASMPLWLQMYAQAEGDYNQRLIDRAETAGCHAIVVTVDTPVLGVRNREQRRRFVLPRHLTQPMNPTNQHARRIAGGSPRRVSLTWRHLEDLRSLCRVPLLVKGILHPDDAERAVGQGVAGIIVSNHGGRNLDTAIATIDALPAIVDRVAGRVPVLVDGGIRRGTDVLKAIALGATAVLIGRPYLYGLAVGGDAGVARTVQLLREELELAMALVGCPRIAELSRSVFA